MAPVGLVVMDIIVSLFADLSDVPFPTRFPVCMSLVVEYVVVSHIRPFHVLVGGDLDAGTSHRNVPHSGGSPAWVPLKCPSEDIHIPPFRQSTSESPLFDGLNAERVDRDASIVELSEIRLGVRGSGHEHNQHALYRRG